VKQVVNPGLCPHRQTRLYGGAVPHGYYTKCTACGAKFFNKLNDNQRGQRRS
jgi:hypothetical protein